MNPIPPSVPPHPAQLWPLALGSILNERNQDNHDLLGGSLRPRHAARATQILATGWDIRTPGEALDSLKWLFGAGHREPYAAQGHGSAESFAAWDWCRAANVAGWAFVAYLLDRETVWQAMLRAALQVQNTYASWTEMGEAYLRGMRIWAGDDGGDRVARSEEAFAKLCADGAGPYRLPWKTALEGAPAPSIDQKTEHVEPGGSIAEAVKRVGSGGRVVVGAGHYAESVTPPHSVEIVARGDGPVVFEAQGRPAVWAKSEVREGVPRAISVSLRGITLRAGRSADGKTLNAASVPGGFLRLHDCTVSATHHGASVREGGVLLVSRSVVEGCGQNGLWCEGGSVAVVASEVRQPTLHGAYVAKSPYANVFEDTSISRAGQVGVVADAELRVRRCTLDAPGRCGVAVHAPVWIADTTITGSAGWGIAVENGGGARLERTKIEGSTGANVDVKEGTLDARGCSIARGVSSGLILQGGARALLVETRVEDNAQGNLFAVAGARVFAAKVGIAGQAVGLWLQDATAAVVESSIESAGGQALDVRGEAVPVLLECRVAGGITLADKTRVCLAECTAEGERTLGAGASIEVVERALVSGEIDRTLAAVQGGDEAPPDAALN